MVDVASVLTIAKLAETVLQMTLHLADWLTKRKRSRIEAQAKATTIEGMKQPLGDVNHAIDDRPRRAR